jgi:hypothetical protein
VVSSGKIQFLVVVLQSHDYALNRSASSVDKTTRETISSKEKAPALYNPRGFAHNPLFPEYGCTEIVWRKEGLRMRIGTVRALPVVVLFALAAAPFRAQQAPETREPNARVAPQTAGSASPSDQKITTVDGRIVDPVLPGEHRFWDRENDLLFAGVGGARALDFSSTLNLRRRGLDEIFLTNSIVDNHPLFGGIEAAATAASIGASYLFHRTGHHRLERWTSIVHFSVALGGAARNYALRTPHAN